MVISGGHGPILAIGCKAGRDPLGAQTVRAFRARFPTVPLVVASLQDLAPRRPDSGVDHLPWAHVLEQYRAL